MSVSISRTRVDKTELTFDSMLYICDVYIQGVTGGTDQTSGECSLGHTIPI